MVDLPMDTGSMVQGMGYASVPVPTTDAADLGGLTAADTAFKSVGTAPPSDYDKPSPLELMSIATRMELAPETGAFLRSNLHEDNWLDPMNPHVAPSPNR